MKKKSWRTSLDLYAKKYLVGKPSHDYWHSYRVKNMAIRIGRIEGADLDVLEASAPLHDRFASSSDYFDHPERAFRLAKLYLPRIGFPLSKVHQAANCIRNHEIYDWKKRNLALPIVDQVFQDADRLDAIGAIGLIRTFTFGGEYGRTIWTPGEKSEIYYKFEDTKKSSVTHLYEKVFRLKDAMNTETGRRIAEHRHKFMEQFLKEFFLEWYAKK